VANIRALRNNATVPELADEPGLADWLDESGLTLAEAARIQPTYGPIDPFEPPDRAYRTATFVSAGIGAAASVWNLLTPRTSPARTAAGVTGVAAGVGALTTGVIGLALDEAEHEVRGGEVALNLGMGVVSVLLGGRTLLRSPDAAERADDASASRQWSLSPWLPEGERTAGVHLAVRF
jgi:hypothetical protein